MVLYRYRDTWRGDEMDSLQIAAILSNGLTADHARSALPDAPVVPDPVATGTRARAGLAGLLRRAADLVASPRSWLPKQERAQQMGRVTLQTIADHVGVSRMTVSNAFSRPDQLSATLRERILAVAEAGLCRPRSDRPRAG